MESLLFFFRFFGACAIVIVDVDVHFLNFGWWVSCFKYWSGRLTGTALCKNTVSWVDMDPVAVLFVHVKVSKGWTTLVGEVNFGRFKEAAAHISEI